ncbi:M20/M25/M40 family metallo-hydrolase [Gemmatimonadota bacterium]
MRRVVPGLAFLILMMSAGASAQEVVDLEMFGKIRAEGYERTQVMEFYDQFVDVYGPRLTGTKIYKESADWVRDRFEEWGLDNARLESWEFGRGWTLEGFTAEMTAPRFSPLIAYPTAWSPSTKGRLEGAPVMLVGKSLAELEALRGTLADRIVMTRSAETRFIVTDRDPPEDERPGGYSDDYLQQEPASRRELQQFLASEQIGAILEPSRGVHGTVFVLGRDRGDDYPPYISMAAEHYNMIVRMLDLGLPVELAVEVKARFEEEDTNGYNILAEIEGTDPVIGDEVVMLGAHLDSWHTSPGAGDNADHVAACMEAMRILKTLGVQPRRTIRVGIWGGEEEGLLGSREWVERHLSGEENQAAREKFSVYFNLDPGYGPVFGFFLEEMESARPIFSAVLDQFADLDANTLVHQGIGSTDHVPFLGAGVPAFEAIHDYIDYDVRIHHTNMDTWERVTEDQMKQASVVMAALIYHAAMRDGMFPRNPPE